MDILFIIEIALYVSLGCILFSIGWFMQRHGWLPLFMPKILKPAIVQATPLYYDLDGKEMPHPVLSKVQKDIQKEYDLQADTTAVIFPKLAPVPEVITPKVNISDTPPVQVLEEKIQTIFVAYCSKCKIKREIKNYVFKDVNTSKGIKRFVQGKCTVCGTNVSNVIKRVV